MVSYERARDSIAVEFEDGAIYLYTYESAGRSNIEPMKKLALAGSASSTFIVKYVRKGYAAKLR